MTVNRVVFEGNKKIEKGQLQNEVQTKPFTRATDASLQQDADRIRNLYNRIGRGYASVSYRTVALPNGRYDVVFTVTEGEKTGVKSINFVGNDAYSASKLRSLMTTTEMNFLSFFKNSDVYDPDRLASDQELIRRFYLKHGYADFQITGADAYFDEAQGGYIVTIKMSEGQQYRVGKVDVQSRIPGVDVASVQSGVDTATGDVYNADAVEKSIQTMTTDAAKRGFAFAQVRPVGQRNEATHTVDIGYVVEEGPRVYIERINIRGNNRTRDYVIRREFDVGEGDAYNKILVDRAERRLNNLGYFKKIRITSEPGSGPDRVVLNVDVEDQPTGSFSVSGGYSTSDGFIGEVSVTETNFLGRGQYVRLAGSLGQRTRGVDFSFTEPYFLGYRLAAGIDLFSKYSDETQYARYVNRMTGGQLRLGLPVTEQSSVTFRYSLYQQNLKIPNTVSQPFNDCTYPIPGFTPRFDDGSPLPYYCQNNGEASLAIKEAQGKTLTSLAGVTLSYNSLNSTRDPTSGIYAEVKPDIAGLGGDSHFLRVTGDARYYREVTDDIIGIVHLQGGHIRAIGDKDLRIVDNFFLGPTLVRGFAPSGIGPRDVSTLDSQANALGGTSYWGASLEAQFPIPILPRELGIKGAVFADAGSLFDYQGKTYFPNSTYGGNTLVDGFAPGSMCAYNANKVQNCIKVRDKNVVRSSVGASILWNSPLGPIRFDYAFALSKDDGLKIDGYKIGGDKTQAFRFSGGGRF